MIPGPIFYVLSAMLIGFGIWRVLMSRKPDQTRRRYHLVWGVLYIVVGAWLLLTQLGVIPPPAIHKR